MIYSHARPRRCLTALVAMGVLVPGNDMTAVRRTAAFFLQNFQDRLAAQRAEAAANKDYDATFKGEATAEQKKAKRKQILSTIGEDLLQAAADKAPPSILPRSMFLAASPSRCPLGPLHANVIPAPPLSLVTPGAQCSSPSGNFKNSPDCHIPPPPPLRVAVPCFADTCASFPTTPRPYTLEALCSVAASPH